MNKESSNKINKKIIQRTRGSFKNFDRLNNLNVEIDSLNSVTPLVPLHEETESHEVGDSHEEDNIQYDDNEYHDEDLDLELEPSPSVSLHQTFEQEENNTAEEEEDNLVVSEPDITHIYLQKRIEQNNLNGSDKPLSLRDLLQDYNYNLEETHTGGNNTTSLTSIRPTARFLEIFRDIFHKIMEEQFILKSYNLYSSSTTNSTNSGHKLEKQKSNEEILSVKLDYKLFEVFMDSVLEDIDTISELVSESF